MRSRHRPRARLQEQLLRAGQPLVALKPPIPPTTKVDVSTPSSTGCSSGRRSAAPRARRLYEKLTALVQDRTRPRTIIPVSDAPGHSLAPRTNSRVSVRDSAYISQRDYENDLVAGTWTRCSDCHASFVPHRVAFARRESC
jgi:hypothetical protein